MMPSAVITSLACLLCSAFAPRGDVPTHPNILVILADDLGYSDLGCYGGEIRTPNLDGLAAGGLRFTQFYNTARCWPSRAALLTGYYAQQVRRDTVPGVPSGGQGKRPKWAKLLPEMLRPLGYRSYHSGKWHVDGMPLANGFDRSYHVEDHGRYFSPRVHFEDDQKLPPVEPGTRVLRDDRHRRPRHQVPEGACGEARRPSRSFSISPSTRRISPCRRGRTDIARYRERYRDGWEAVRAERWKTDPGRWVSSAASLSDVERDVGPPYDFPGRPRDARPRRGQPARAVGHAHRREQREFQATKMAIHAAMVDRMDREIGRVLDQLRAMGAFDNTLIFFLSDNGASAEIMVRDDGHDPAAPAGSAASHLCLGPGWSTVANTPFRRHKTWVHEGGIATPLIVHWPRGIRRPRRAPARPRPRHRPRADDPGSRRCARRDTSARPAVPAPPGKSLVPAFAHDGTVKHDDLWWDHEGNRAIRVGDWKLVAARDEPWELYDLATDRTETRNLARRMPPRSANWPSGGNGAWTSSRRSRTRT